MTEETWKQELMPVWGVCEFLNQKNLGAGEFAVVNTADPFEADVVVIYKSEDEE